MKQIINADHCEWPNVEVDFPEKIKLFIDSVEGFNKNNYNILLVREPSFINPVITNSFDLIKNFDAVLSYHEELINYPNFHFLPFGTCWVTDWTETEKDFSVSNLTGAKMFSLGHKFRHTINSNQNLITVPKNFYISNRVQPTPNPFGNKELKDSKHPLFTSQFHICIENCKQNNYFSEKVIDCFATKTVPVYYGADNIGNFFNKDGILVANSPREMINICNNLNESTYNSMKDAIEDNYNRAEQYKDMPKYIKNIIEGIDVK